MIIRGDMDNENDNWKSAGRVHKMYEFSHTLHQKILTKEDAYVTAPILKQFSHMIRPKRLMTYDFDGDDADDAKLQPLEDVYFLYVNWASFRDSLPYDILPAMNMGNPGEDARKGPSLVLGVNMWASGIV